MSNTIILDPASICGWAVFSNQGLLDSGTINTANAEGNKFSYLERGLKKILEKYQPIKAIVEQKAHFVRGKYKPLNVKSVMTYGSMHDTVTKTLAEQGIKTEYIDTRKMPKKKLAQAVARQVVVKKRISTHEAECICWGYALLGVVHATPRGETK